MAVRPKKSRRKVPRIDNPLTASWKELAATVPQKDWYGFRDLVNYADVKRELKPERLVERYPNHPVVLVVKRFVETGNRRLINKALKAVAGTDKNYLLRLMKS